MSAGRCTMTTCAPFTSRHGKQPVALAGTASASGAWCTKAAQLDALCRTLQRSGACRQTVAADLSARSAPTMNPTWCRPASHCQACQIGPESATGLWLHYGYPEAAQRSQIRLQRRLTTCTLKDGNQRLRARDWTVQVWRPSQPLAAGGNLGTFQYTAARYDPLNCGFVDFLGASICLSLR